MLIRLVLGIADRGLRKELIRLLGKEDIGLEVIEDARTLWQQTIRSCGDVVVLSESAIPQPAAQSIGLLKELPETPASVVLVDDGEPGSNERWVAAGVDLALHSREPAKAIATAILGLVAARQSFFESTAFARLRATKSRLSDFVSESPVMHAVMKEVFHVVHSAVPLLIQGETGVGKEHLAKAIHVESPRSGGPFVTLNMAAIPEQLMESELFGHTQGAFTGATRARRGAFEQAHHGTLFLDEIGDMPLHMQSKLLRTLQEYEVRPLGSERSTWVDVRVIAATNRDLEGDVHSGRFRKDLFYRLSVIPITLPPLRERREDIPAMVRRFFDLRKVRHGGEMPVISEEVMAALCRYDWPGNIRELFNVLERATLLSAEFDGLLLDYIPTGVRAADVGAGPSGVDEVVRAVAEGKSLQETVKQLQEVVERRYLEAALRQTRGRVGMAARLAGIHSRSMYNKMQQYGIDKAQFKKKDRRDT